MESYVITIGRGYGSGGKTIGKMLSKELGIPFYDKEIIRMASDESGIHESLFVQADEKLKSPFLKHSKAGAYKGDILSPQDNSFVSDDNLFNYQAKIIKDLAKKEPCIIVGRCADFILKHTSNTVNVFVFAPEASCIQNVIDMYGVSEKEARKQIMSIDKYRNDYYKYYTAHEWTDARNYDLSLNSEKLGYQKCVDIVKNYLSVRFE